MFKKILKIFTVAALLIAANSVQAQVTKPSQGGTGVSTYTTGDILYASTTNPFFLNKLTIGSNGQCLGVVLGLPGWLTCGSGGGSAGGTFSTSTSQTGGVFTNHPNNTTDVVTIGSSSTTTAPFWFDPNISKYYLTGNGTSTGSFASFKEIKGTFFTATSTTATSTFAGNIIASQQNIQVPNLTLGTGSNVTTYGFTVAGGRSMVGYDSIRGSTVINSGSSKGFDVYVNGTNGTFLSGTNVLTGLSSGFVGVSSSTPTCSLAVGNYFCQSTSGLLQFGFTPWNIYENGFHSFVMQQSNPGYYNPRSIIALQGADGGVNPANGGDTEATFTAEIPVAPYSFNGTDYTDREFLDIGCEKYNGDHNCYAYSSAQGSGLVNPYRIGFIDYDKYATVNDIPYSIFFDPSGASAYGYASTTSNSANRYDKTIPLQVSSSTASILFALDSTPRNNQFTVSVTGIASTTGVFKSASTTASSVFPYASTTAITTATFFDSGLTTARIPYTSTGGLFVTSSGLQFNDTSNRITVPYASTTAVTVGTDSGLSIGALNGILKATSGAVGTATNGTDYTLISALTCGAGQHVNSISAAGSVTCSPDTGSGGGSGGGTWSTTTSQVAGQFANYSNNATDVVVIGSTSTTTAPFYFDPNIGIASMSKASTTLLASTNIGIGTSTPTAPLEITKNLGSGIQTAVQISDLGNGATDEFALDWTNRRAGNIYSPWARASASGGTSFTNSTLTLWTANSAKALQRALTINNIQSTGLGTTTPDQRLTVWGSADVADNITASNFTGTSSVASIFPYASTTALSATTLCLTGDICRTTWPTGVAFPFTPTTNFNALTNATGTPLWLQAGLQASSTSQFDNSTTSIATVSSLYISGIAGSRVLVTGTNGLVQGNSSLPIALGGTFATSFSSGAVITFDGTRFVSSNVPGQGLVFSGGNLGIGSSSPSSQYSMSSTKGVYVAGDSFFGGALTSTSTSFSTFPYASTTMITSGNASTTVLTVSNSPSALLVTNSAGLVSAYAGVTCVNQFLRALSAIGGSTCATVGAADVSLANLSATDNTITFSGTYTGATARTIGLNLGNANTWTALQSLFGNASTTQLSVFNKSYFGTTATTTIDSTGNIVLPSGSNITITGKADGCATFASGVINSTGSACGSGGGGTNFFTQSGNNIFLNVGSVLQFPIFSATSTTATSTIVNALGIGTTTTTSMLEVNGGFHTEEQVLGTSTSMSVDFCSKNTSNDLSMGVGSSNITLSFTNAGACFGKHIWLTVENPNSGVIGSTTIAAGSGTGTVNWDGYTNPGNNTTLGGMDEFLCISKMGTSTPMLWCRLNSSLP